MYMYVTTTLYVSSVCQLYYVRATQSTLVNVDQVAPTYLCLCFLYVVGVMSLCLSSCLGVLFLFFYLNYLRFLSFFYPDEVLHMAQKSFNEILSEVTCLPFQPYYSTASTQSLHTILYRESNHACDNPLPTKECHTLETLVPPYKIVTYKYIQKQLLLKSCRYSSTAYTLVSHLACNCALRGNFVSFVPQNYRSFFTTTHKSVENTKYMYRCA